CAATRHRARPARPSGRGSAVPGSASSSAGGAPTDCWKRPGPTRPACCHRATGNCWSARSSNCSSRRARCTGSCGWPAPLPTWMPASRSRPPTWPKRSATGAWTAAARRSRAEPPLVRAGEPLVADIGAVPHPLRVLQLALTFGDGLAHPHVALAAGALLPRADQPVPVVAFHDGTDPLELVGQLRPLRRMDAIPVTVTVED